MTSLTSISKEDYQQKLIAKLVSKPGYKGGADAKCIDCIYDPYDDGTWRFQVEECTSPSCPLYPSRPTTTNK